MRILEGVFMLWIMLLVTMFAIILAYAAYTEISDKPLFKRDVEVIQKEKVVEKEEEKVYRPTYNVTGSGEMVCLERPNGTKKCYEDKNG